jgi:RNA polymerase sigma factor (sigma-70 family)
MGASCAHVGGKFDGAASEGGTRYGDHAEMTGVLSFTGPSRPRRITGRATSDHELVELIRGGDDRAFEVLFERYRDRITAYVRGMVRDHGRAEDITQEVFLSALRRMRETDRAIAFRPWIYEIAKNACIDAHRRSRRTQEVSYDADESLGPADQGKLVSPGAVPDAVETRESLENLQGALGALSESHADVLVLRELEGLSYREIGDRLGMSRASVESTLFRARKRLETEYQDLVSGERCRQIQASFESMRGGRPRLRDRRQVSRHLAWCQACRHQARLAGLDIEVGERVPLRTKVGGLLPIPAFIRDRLMRTAASGQLTGAAGDSLVEWGRALAGVAAIAVAGIGVGVVAEKTPILDANAYSPSPRLYAGGGDGTQPPLLRSISALAGTERGLAATGGSLPAAPGGAGALGAPVSAGPLAPQGAGTRQAAAGAPAGAAGSAVAGSAGAAGGAVQGLGATTGAAVTGLTGTTSGAVQGVTQTVGGAVRGVTQTAGGAARGVTDTAGNLVRDVTSNPSNLGPAVNDAVRSTTQTVTNTVRGTTDTVNSTVRGTTDTVNTTVQGTTGTVNQTVTGVTQTTTNVVQGVTNTVQQVTRQAAPTTSTAAPAPATSTTAPTTTSQPAPTSTGPVQQVVQSTTGALGGLLGGG